MFRLERLCRLRQRHDTGKLIAPHCPVRRAVCYYIGHVPKEEVMRRFRIGSCREKQTCRLTAAAREMKANRALHVWLV